MFKENGGLSSNRAHCKARILMLMSFSALVMLMVFPCIVRGEGHTVSLVRKISRGVVAVNSLPTSSKDLFSPVPHKGIGSGFIIDKAGHVLTTVDALVDLYSIEVTLADGVRWPASLKGMDEKTGLAVIEIQSPPDVLARLRPLEFDTKRPPATGQDAVALGRTILARPIAIKGIISAVDRSVATSRGRIMGGILQTSFVIASGLNGAPLFDLSGKVIGVCTRMFTPSPMVSGAGFAIPAGIARWVSAQLIENGEVERAWLGIGLQAVGPALQNLLDLPVTKGAMVTKVAPGGPAYKAGLRAGNKSVRVGNRILRVGGDIIVAINGAPVASEADVLKILRHKKPGDELLVSIYRGNRLRRVRIKLERQKD